jgi:hypothetical protein
MTQIIERPAQRTPSVTTPAQRLLAEGTRLISSLKGTSVERSAELVAELSLLVSDPESDRAATMALFYRNNAGGRDTLGTLFYGEEAEDSDGPMVAPPASRVANLAYRTALNSLHAALSHLVPAGAASLDEKRDFWENVKTHLAPGQAMDDEQVSEVTAADLNTVLKDYYGAGRVKKLTAYTDSPESLNFVLFNPRTVENSKLEIRASFRLNGEEPPVGAFSLRTMNGVVHFV